MPKRNLQQEERRLLDSGQADINKQKRIVAEIAKNKELQSELANLRKYYKIAFKNISEQIKWFDLQPIATLEGFSNDVKAIVKKYSISDEVEKELWKFIWNIPRSGYEVTAALGSMPKIQWTKESEAQLIITPETDIKNELVLWFIVEWQKARINNHDKPPQPQRIKGSKEKNWMPVWEWSMKHPYITRKELAALLHISYTHLKSKLEEIDKKTDKTIPFSFQT